MRQREKANRKQLGVLKFQSPSSNKPIFPNSYQRVLSTGEKASNIWAYKGHSHSSFNTRNYSNSKKCQLLLLQHRNMIVLNSSLRRTQVWIYNLVSVRLFTRWVLCTLVSLIGEEKANKQANPKQGCQIRKKEWWMSSVWKMKPLINYYLPWVLLDIRAYEQKE